MANPVASASLAFIIPALSIDFANLVLENIVVLPDDRAALSRGALD